MQSLPKITIVTVCLNSSAYIEDCIKSVIEQAYPNLEYIIADGGSTDGTLAIIEKYQSHFAKIITGPDGGPANALNNAFAYSSGEIMGWLNSDDKLHSQSLFAMAEIFNSVQAAEWIMGYPSWLTPDGNFVDEIYYKSNRFYYSPSYISNNFHLKFARWSKWRFAMGDFSAIQQESVFWRRSLWERAGGRLNENTIAYDLELWTRFFEYTELYTTNVLLGGFRIHGKQLSIIHEQKYYTESEALITLFKRRQLKNSLLCKLKLSLARITKVFYYYNIPLLSRIYIKLLKLPAYLVFDLKKRKFEINDEM
ncbi:MAG: glycosyltransferase family 2 protein [Chitinophagales bacterium]